MCHDTSFHEVEDGVSTQDGLQLIGPRRPRPEVSREGRDMRGHQWVLESRPVGMPTERNFRLVDHEVPEPREGELGLRVAYASVDPYMRTKMVDAVSYTEPYRLGEVISCRSICTVELSKDDRFVAGDVVSAFTGWQTHAVVAAAQVTPIDTSVAPPAAFLGVLGMPGLTAYGGLLKFGRPVRGETLVVAAALGPVGSTVAQIARARGVRVVAIAGGPEKTAILRERFGMETVIDHRAADFEEQLVAATPDGIDIYFENVGGPVADAVLPRLNLYGRIPVCGMVASYNHTGVSPGPDRLPAFYRQVLAKSLDVRGFISSEFTAELQAEFRTEMSHWVRSGTIRHLEHETVGLENAPAALIGMLRGDNMGKTVVRLT